MDRHTIAADGIAATIAAAGAELCSLRDAAGRELLWQALPAWPRHAPVLFPIVGRLAGDRLTADGTSYALPQHGFARDRRFAWVERGRDGCRLALTDDAETRARYPWPFAFELGYAVAGDTLAVTFSIFNPGDATLPASMGAHPAFRWPLADGVPKAAHTLTFAAPEPAPVRRLAGGLLLPDPVPSPIAGRVLRLDEALFAADAIILDQPASRSVDEAGGRVPVHRAVVRLRQPGRLRRRVRHQAGPAADPARRAARGHAAHQAGRLSAASRAGSTVTV